MSLILFNPETGREVIIEPSKAELEKLQVTIFAKDKPAIYELISILKEYGCENFTVPAKCADGRYGAVSKIKNGGDFDGKNIRRSD